MASDQDWQPVVLRKSNSIAKTAKSATELNTAMRKGEVEAVRKVTHTANPNARKVRWRPMPRRFFLSRKLG